MSNKPLLLVVTGRPGSGKTTLAHLLAREICCPVISRDEVKEGYCVTHNSDHTQLPSDTNRNIYEAYFDVLATLINQQISVVAEAAFQDKLWKPKLTNLMQSCEIRIVRCIVDPLVARKRAIERGLQNPRRERFHRDFAVHAAKKGLDVPIGNFTPVDMDVPTLDVQTDGDYSPGLEEIYSFAMSTRIEQGAQPDAFGAG